jgi:phosphatidylglycerol lysyltransferase
MLAGAVLYTLLPAGSVKFSSFMVVFLLGQVSGLVSQVPGGLGVFDTIVVLGLAPFIPASTAVASLLAYRMIYYLLPLAIAVAAFGIYELLDRKARLKRFAEILGQWVPNLAPSFFACTTFLSGVILIISGATPTVGWRLLWLRDTLPLPAVEISHFLGSLIGIALIFLARGLQQRLDAAYMLSILLFCAGIMVSLLKGLDFEEAGILSFMLITLLPCRNLFYRKASLLAESFTMSWIASVILVLIGSLWLLFFSYKHVEYSNELLWSFTFRGDAPRSLRSLVGVVAACVSFAGWRLLRPVAPRSHMLLQIRVDEEIAPIVQRSLNCAANLALLGDKLFLLSESKRSFIMYGVEGRSWIAMGDPIGPSEEHAELVWRFHEMCDRFGGWTVFYEIGRDNLHLYLDIGLMLFKIGEEASVPLDHFNLEGKGRKGFRHIKNRFEKEGFTFEIIEPKEAAPLFPELKGVSDAWLKSKNTREKRFSLGSFDAGYLQRFPFALVRKGQKIFAFANLWLGAEKEEFSVDLMRYTPGGPPDIMEYLFIMLMLWGREQQYCWFNLGMAPLAGLEGFARAPLWNRLGLFIYTHGEHFYNFQGLRKYKEKFDPRWEPKYLACADGLALPRIVANIASLVSGGVKGIIAK